MKLSIAFRAPEVLAQDFAAHMHCQTQASILSHSTTALHVVGSSSKDQK